MSHAPWPSSFIYLLLEMRISFENKIIVPVPFAKGPLGPYVFQ